VAELVDALVSGASEV